MAKVNREDHEASHVEIAFRDEYLSRSDMWRLVVSDLAGKVIHKGQRLAFMGTIKVLVKAIYIRGQRVSSAFFSSSTKPIFRSESARYVLFIQMSKEMWDFDTDGTGEIMFDKVINGFLPDLFKRWQQINARHLVTIVMFTRLESEQTHSMAPTASSPHEADDRPNGHSSSQDYYRVVVSDMPSGDWSDILVQLKKEFRVFLRDVTILQPSIGGYGATSERFSAGLTEAPSQSITGHPTSALHGNILEAVNLASSQFSCDYIDRDLVRTGVSVIVITPGTGLFEVDYNLLATTTDNLIENGVGIDLVCLSRLPLHSVPLFKYHPPQISRPRIPDSSNDHAREAFARGPNSRLTVSSRQPNSLGDVGVRSFGSSFESIQSLSDTGWKYGIPHWVDVSFWTTSTERSRIPSILFGPRGHGQVRGDRPRWKPFIPRVRMYELQMMGVMENSINQIRLPHLARSTSNIGNDSGVLDSVLHPKPADGPRPVRGSSTSTQSTGAKSQMLSSSITSPNGPLGTHQTSRYSWIDEYDELLFKHPRQRQAARKTLWNTKVTSLVADRNRQHDRMSLDSGTSLSPSSILSGSVRNLGRSGHFDRAMKERDLPWPGVYVSSSKTPSVTSEALHPKPPKPSNRTSLGFRGFGAGTGKATASTELSVEHAPAASIAPRRIQGPAKLGNTSHNDLKPKRAIKNQDDRSSMATSSEANEPSRRSTRNSSEAARPIPIRNPTEIRIIAETEGSHSQGSGSSTTLVLQRDADSGAASGLQQQDTLHSQATSPSDGLKPPQMSPKSAMAPWLTIINPSNPNKIDSNSTSRLGRWQHIFPKKLRASKIKWKSLCSPAAVPLTTEDFPSAEELVLDYDSSKHKVDIPVDEELLERPRSRDWLIREMMGFRFSQGFQVVIGPRLAHSLYLPNFESFNIFNDNQLAQTNTTIVMTRGSMVHKITTATAGHVEVECLTRRSMNIQSHAAASPATDVYKPVVRAMLAEEYAILRIPLAIGQRQPDWNLIDSYIAGHGRQEAPQQDDNLRSWRARLVLIPVSSVSSTRRSMLPLNEDNEEEIRLEGIKKLTQTWQRYRHIPPSERRFQASTRKRKDENPLDIMYQTRNPSAIVWAEKDNMGEDISTGKPVQLLPESELFQRSNLNVQELAQTIQGDKGVRMQDRRWHWKLHYNCFIGFELTSWLLQNFRDVDTREEAVELGNELMDNGLFQHVSQRHNFRDGNYFYHVTSQYLSARPQSRSTWFGSRKADMSIPSTPVSEAAVHESPRGPPSRSSSTEENRETDASTPTVSRHRLSVELGKSLLYDVDHRKRSYRPELITLHYDRIHNPDNCYHIRIDWMNVTSKLIEDAIVSWATAVERFGLKLVELPLAEASTITSMHPFRAPVLVRLTRSPPSEQPQTYFDATSFAPQAKAEKHFYQIAIMKKFDFVLDFEAASAFPPDVDVTYSWGKPDYKYPQYIHRSGTLLAQITEDGDFLLLANRLYTNRSPGAREGSRSEETAEREGPGSSSRFSSARSGTHRGSPYISPYASPVVRATADSMPPPRASNSSSLFATPSHIKKQFQAFCADAAGLEVFYNDVLNKVSTPATSTPRLGTPMMESNIPALGLPPSLTLRERSPAPKAKTRIVGGGSPKLATAAADGTK